MRFNTVDFISLGCSKNLVDTERLMRQLSAAGYAVRFEPKRANAETVVINTCAFIADAQSIDMILKFAELKKRGKIRRLFVMGCLSQRFLNELQVEIPEVDAFFGKFDYMDLLNALGTKKSDEIAHQRTLTTPRHYAYLKIAEGCNRTCSYCAIPLITGAYKSRPMEEIVDEARWLVDQGVRELIVIAQDLTYYGVDLYKKQMIAQLVERLSDIEGVRWIRLHYAYPTQFPYDLLRVMRERDNVCKYLDLAFQHISDNMLQLMRRNITKRQTYDLIDRIRREVPDIVLRTTLMVGHPGETEQDFQELLQFVRDIRFERLGAFAFSNEQGTYAYNNYKDDIPEQIKQQRLEKLMALQDEISDEIAEKRLGNLELVVVDRKEKTEEGIMCFGRSQYESPDVDDEILLCVEDPRNVRVGRVYEMEIEDYEDHTYFAMKPLWYD